MTEEEITWLGEVFGGTDVLSSADLCDYFDVIRAAYDVHVDRERIRNGLWKDYPAVDQFNQIKVKDDRILRSLERLQVGTSDTGRLQALEKNIIEEGYDIINYTVFGVRIVKGIV